MCENLNKIMIGFSNGCFYKLKIDRWSEEMFKILGKYNAVELNVIDLKSLEKVETLDRGFLKNFEFVSVHMPKRVYNDDEETGMVLERFEGIYKRFKVDNFVVHPDNIESLKWFNEFKMPFSVENMDNRKDKGRFVEEIGFFIDKGFGFVLDINHVYTNDKSLSLADEMINKFKDQLKEVHLSGYLKENIHAPLFKTKQIELIEKIKDLGVPVIIESVFGSLEEMEKETEFVNRFL